MGKEEGRPRLAHLRKWASGWKCEPEGCMGFRMVVHPYLR